MGIPVMKVQRIRLPNQRMSWIVLDDEYRPVAPINSYLRYLENLNRSPNTVHTYALHLKQYWEYVHQAQLDWTHISLETIAHFMGWLRFPDSKVVSIQPPEAHRSERTINAMISAVIGFYDFQSRLDSVSAPEVDQFQVLRNRSYKPFLHHLTKGKETKTRLVKLKEPKRFPKILSHEQVETVMTACKRLRDKFLVCLLYETGMRIGQALGLRHEDMRSWDQEIHVLYRTDNLNGARAKSKNPNVVHVSQAVMNLYSLYLIDEYPEHVDSDYVFVNIWDGEIGHPLSYSTATSLFRRLSREVGFKVHPHLLRHTHATELIRAGWGMALIQKRLGHASIQTTMDTYSHLTQDDLKQAFQSYLKQKE